MSLLETPTPKTDAVDPSELARRAHARILVAMQTQGMGATLASSMKTSESTVSRIKNEGLESALAMIYYLGFKVVKNDKLYIESNELNMLRSHYARTVAMNGPSMDLFGDME